MRVCIVYDCLYPYTIGGAERWYRSLAERLAATGADVTYLTLRQWERGAEPSVPGVRVVAVGPALALYTRSGRRRVLPPLRFGFGVLVHLLRHGRRYDVVHTASFPYFSLLAAGVARRRGRFRILVDWHEVWTRAYWDEYLGPLGGRVGWWVQRLCLRVPQRAFCFSRLHERRLRELGLRGELTLLEGQYAEDGGVETPATALPVAVYAGRFIPEKQVPSSCPRSRRQGSRSPSCAGSSTATAPSARRCCARLRRSGSTVRSLRPASWTRTCSSGRLRARSASCCPPGGRATAASWSKPPREACPRSSSRARTTPRPSSSRRA